MMTRKQFLGSLVGGVAGALVIGCKEGDGSPQPTVDAPAQTPIDAPAQLIDAPAQTTPDAPTAACAQTVGAIGSNHGHAVMVPVADVQAGVEATYNIKGASGHPHTITITAALFAMLKAGQTITVVSSNDANHAHSVMISCA